MEHTEEKNTAPYCTCTDLACPMHPTRHNRGCTPCVVKNLKQGEIPSCFWRTFTTTKGRSDFSKEAFAKALLEKEGK